MYIKQLVTKSILILFLFMSQSSIAQDEFDIIRDYKKALVKSDSLLASGNISQMNLDELLTITKKLDSRNPNDYISQALAYFKQGDFNESGFLYNLAKLRLVDLNENTLGAKYDFYGEQKVYVEEGVFLYLAADINNYKKVIELAINYYRDNEYLYINKKQGYHKAQVPTEYIDIMKEFDGNSNVVKQSLYETREDMRKKVDGYYLMLNSK